MSEYQILVIINLIIGAGIIIWVNKTKYEGKKAIIYLLALVLPVPTLLYLFLLYKFTDQLKK
jgi:ABC-type sulfate transport system permease subunit